MLSRFRSFNLFMALIMALGMVFTATPPLKVQAVSTTLVISQFQVAGINAADEFVELHNVANDPIDINNYSLVYRSGNGTDDILLYSWATSVIIPSGGYYLIAHELYDGTTLADVSYNLGATGTLAGASAGIGIRDESGTLLDSVGYGSATNAFVEAATTSTPSANRSKSKLNNGCTDTDNNFNDYTLTNPSAPQNSSSPAVICTLPDIPPTITSTTPLDEASDVPTPSDLTVVFSEAVTITPESFFDIFCDAVEQTGTVSGSGTTYAIHPTEDLPALAASCVVTIYATAVTDQDGTPDNMAADYSWNFATADDEAPAVLSTSPAIAAIDITVDTNITVNFSEPVDVDPIDWYSIHCDTTGDHTATTSGGPLSFTLDPTVNFGNSEDCDVTIWASYVTDQDTNDDPDNMNGNYYLYFTTVPADIPPTVLSVLPVDNSMNVPVDNTLTVTFSEPVTVASDFAAVNCAMSGAHTYSINETGDPTFILTPAVPFNVGEVCTVTIDNEKVSDEDFLPDNLVNDYIWDFTTIYDPAPFVEAVTPTNGLTNIPLDSNLTVLFNEGVVVIGDWYTISCANSGFHFATVTGEDPDAYIINPDENYTPSEVCTVTLLATHVEDVDANDPYDKMASDYIWSFTTTICGDTHTQISTVQGSGTASPIVGSKVTVEGIVVADMQGSASMNGYFIQSMTGDRDSDPLTSEGLMIYNNTAVNLGDYVRVAGTVAETQKLTEINSVTSTYVCSSGNTVPDPIDIDLPDTANSTFTLEPYEDMLVHFPETLTVQQNYFQARFGQITLGAGGRIAQMNNVSLGGGSLYEYTRMIILDDANRNQNPNPTPYYGVVDGFLRAGDIIPGGIPHVGGVTGIIDQGAINSTVSPYMFPYNYYRLQPTIAPIFGTPRTNPRTETPPDVGGALKVVGFNTLNYFTTIDCGNPDGDCVYDPTSGYISGNTPRGADSPEEFTRQQTKLLAAMAALDADVYGLLELESWDGAAAPQALVTALNTYLFEEEGRTDTYAVVPDPALGYFNMDTEPDSDYIQVGLIYRTDTVSLVGDSLSVDDVIFDRSPFAQVFMENATGERFVVVANHFKSKGSCPTGGEDADQGDGQGCWNARRVLQAEALLDFIDGTLAPLDPDVMVIGDLNAYGGEDPIQTLVDGGLINQIAAHVPVEDRYSFVFDGAAGYLDHFLSTPSMNVQIQGVDFFHINADEISFIDYNTEFKDGSYAPDLYSAHMYRSTDHDPVLIGLDLMSPLDLTALELLGSRNGTDYGAVFGSLEDGYILPLDPGLEFQYLDAGAYTVTRDLADGSNGFYIDETSVPAGFFEYWAARGVDAGPTYDEPWMAVMWQIINGNQPMFFLKVTGSEYSLVDGLTYLTTATDAPWSVSGDYPLGDYSFTGTILDRWGESDTVDVAITFEAAPDITAFELLGTRNLTDWDAVAGSIDGGFTYAITPNSEFQYLDAGSHAVNKTLADGYYGFFLEQTIVPAGFFEYWAGKGVDAGASGWQYVMWQIINGDLPMFYLKVNGSDYSLIEGLTYLTTATDTPVRVPGDYPPGVYSFTGSIEDLHYGLGVEEVTITFERFYLSFMPALRR
jgi:predicted extracellular nuclease